MKEGLLGQLRVQTMLLNPPYKASKMADTQRLTKKLTAKKKKEMKVFDIPREKQNYALYLPH